MRLYNFKLQILYAEQCPTEREKMTLILDGKALTITVQLNSILTNEGCKFPITVN